MRLVPGQGSALLLSGYSLRSVPLLLLIIPEDDRNVTDS